MRETRNTIQRDLVLQAVRSMHTHPTAEEIYRRVAGEHPSISKGTVYRNLALLAEKGEIQKVSHLNAADRFDFQLHPHYHFHCRGCDKVFDIALAHDPSLIHKAQANSPFVVESCELVFTGLCEHCKHGRHAVC